MPHIFFFSFSHFQIQNVRSYFGTNEFKREAEDNSKLKHHCDLVAAIEIKMVTHSRQYIVSLVFKLQYIFPSQRAVQLIWEVTKP